jgi:glycosidase
MYEQFGFVQSASGQHSISLFVPDNQVDASQYTGGPSRIISVSVIGDFQHIVAPGVADWDAGNALQSISTNHPNGFLFVYSFPKPLPAGYYQYKFVVTFQNGTVRQIGDPCTKYGGDSDDRSAFVVGGAMVAATPIANRLPTGDLQIYELMIDDFTKQFRGATAPLDAVVTKLDTLAQLNVNAIEFMPWTAWPDDSGLTTFSWGYNPAYFFSVESSYMADPGNPLDRLSRLSNLINECHKRNLGVVLDIVLQHASQGATTNGFPYYWLWQNANECPFVGSFVSAPTFGSLPLNYNNFCTQQFVTDVCTYWIDRFKLDGLRFDQVTGYDNPAFPAKGAPGLIAALNTYFQTNKITNFALMLEDSWGYDAIGDANNIKPTGAWFDMFRSGPFGIFSGFAVVGKVDTTYMRILNASLDFNYPIGPVNYIENHDHGSVTCRVGSRGRWFKVQPYLIALATCPGAILIHNGQEWGQYEDIWEDDSNAPAADARVQPRPLLWEEANDAIGAAFIPIHQMLLDLRASHPGLRSPNFYPSFYDQQWSSLSPDGYGIDVGRQIVIFHRWGNDATGTLERFIIVLNFNDFDQAASVPFPVNGTWTDLINGNQTVDVQNFWLTGYSIPSNWGSVFWIR